MTMTSFGPTMTRHIYCWVFLELLTLCLVVTVAQESTGTTDPYILLANQNFIQKLSLAGRNERAIVSKSTSRIVGLDYDYRRNYLFWSDRDLNTIVRASLNGSNQRVLINTTLRFPDGVAWDWVNQKLYWLEWNALESKIVVLDPLLGHKKVLFSSNNSMSRLRSIIVDPSNRWLYWSDWAGDVGSGFIGKIERSSMDGQNRETLHEFLGWPAPLTIDYENQMLYWADTRTKTIERSRVDGSGREILLQNNTYGSFSMSFFQDKLYLSNVGGGLGSFMSGASAVTSHINFDMFTYGIQVVSQARQVEAPNPCAQNNGGCSHLCLLSATTQQRFSCVCPDELILAANMRTCVDPDSTEPFPTPTIPGVLDSTAASDTNPTPDVMTKPEPTSEPAGFCRSFLCRNGGTCHNIGQNAYFCECVPGYGGRNCESGVKAPDSEFTISAPIFVGVIAGLVLIIFLMFVITLCVFGLRKRRKMTLDGSNPSPVTILNHRTTSTSVNNDHDYDSIRSNHSSPAPKTHYYIPLPGQSASNDSSPRESGIQDTAVKVDPDYSNSAWHAKLQTL